MAYYIAPAQEIIMIACCTMQTGFLLVRCLQLSLLVISVRFVENERYMMVQHHEVMFDA